VRAVLSRPAWLLLAAAVVVPGSLLAIAPRDRPASEAAGNARGSGAEAQSQERREAEPPPGQGTRVLTLAEKICRQRQGCTDPAAPCRPCDR
jgi:hypothetical protein